MNSEFFDLIQQKTGFTLEWELFKTVSGQTSSDEQINLLMASGKPPNLIDRPTPAWAGRAAKEGGLAYIDDDLPKYPFLSKFMTPNFRSYATVNGKMYVIPAYLPQTSTTLAVRKDWLRELNLAEPKTTEELYAVLKAVKAAKPNVIPLVISGSFEHLSSLLGSFGIPNERDAFIVIEDGKASFPYRDNRIVEFIQYMHRLYAEGLVDKEFMIDKEAFQKLLAGNGFVMDVNYVNYVRQMGVFKEKNPSGILEYFDPPKGPHGESGILVIRALQSRFVIPAIHQNKVDLALEFLEIVNSREDILDLFACGIVGRDVIKNPDGTFTKTDNFAKISGTKGYYSILDIVGHFTRINNILEGFDKPIEFMLQTAKDNDIYYAPVDVAAEAGSAAPELSRITIDAVLNMIVNGYSDAAFNKMKQDQVNAGLEKALAIYQAWYDKR
ncbi:MAG: extracellular solute-binding protein [Treponema sp.]|jgi:putative aldouronate transport system substrate-binding protein|nr:extracellular solute-binding protein [Treponema sp.]